MRKQLYLDIKERLKSIKNGDETLFKHYDLWNRQVEFVEQETAFACPAVFVELGVMEWRTLGQRVQDCTLKVSLHIVTEWYAGTADYSPTEAECLDFLDLADRVVYAMHGFNTQYINSWMRTASLTNHDHERYVDSVEEYTCNLRDYSACKESIPINPDIKVIIF